MSVEGQADGKSPKTTTKHKTVSFSKPRLPSWSNLSGSNHSDSRNRHKRNRTSSGLKKRLVVEVQVMNSKQIFKQEIHRKCCYFEYLCCGTWHCVWCSSYCVFGCIWMTEYKLIQKIGNKLSKKLNAKGIDNVMRMKDGEEHSFEIEIRGRSAATQMMGKMVMGKMIKEKLQKKGVVAKVNCSRRTVSAVDLSVIPKNDFGPSTDGVYSPLSEHGTP